MTPRAPKLALILCPDVQPWERPAFEAALRLVSARVPVETIECDGNLKPVVAAVGKSGATAVWAVSRQWRALGRRLSALLPARVSVTVSALGMRIKSAALPALFWENMRPHRAPRYHVLAHSEFAFRFLGEMERIPASRLKQLPLPYFESTRPAPLAFGNGPVTIGVLGPFATETNLQFALNVAHYLAQRRTDVRFRLVGGGPLRAHLITTILELGLSRTVELIEPRGKWEGSGLDLLLYHPLRNEHHIPLLIAAAEGVPAICSEILGVELLIRDGHDGFILPVNETKPMAELALRLVDDAALRRFFGGRLRERLSHELYWGNFADAYAGHFFPDLTAASISRAA